MLLRARSWSRPARVTTGRRPPTCCARSPATRRCAAGCWSTGACRAWSRRRSSARCSGLGGTIYPGRVPQSAGRALPAGLGRRRGARRHRRAAGAARDCRRAWLLPLLAFAGAWGATVLVIGICRGRRRRRRGRPAAGRRRGRGDPGRAALVPDARLVGRDGEPAGRAELGAGRACRRRPGPGSAGLR